jgi:uncharacterized protein (TIGR02594 family)
MDVVSFIQKPLAPWISWMIYEMATNVREIPGIEANPDIIRYHSYTTLKATSDEIPWCSSALCACFEEIGLDSPRSAAARSWLTWGMPCSAFVLGSVAIFERGKPNSGSGHVAIALAENNGVITCIGGNQSNTINIQDFPKTQLLGYRWPKGFELTNYYKAPSA